MQNNEKSEASLITLFCCPYYGIPLSPDENARVSQFLLANKLDKRKLDKNLLTQLSEANSNSEEQWNKVWNRIKNPTTTGKVPGKVIRMPAIRRLIGAAVIVVAAGIIAYKYIIPTFTNKPGGQNTITSIDIQPGGPKATLLLTDNSSIDLYRRAVGNIANEDGTKISKPDSTQIVYEATAGKIVQKAGTNILNTPRAGIFKVTLPDKTVMYLNAESSVVYPVAFTGPRREVTVSKGEVYFEIAKNSKPFIVRKGDQSIEVLGTKFNINTYNRNNQENIITTLLEGSIQLTKGHEHRILNPREQLIAVSNSENLEVRKDVNTEGVISWKNGYFDFKGARFQDILDELERWYNIKVDIDDISARKLEQSRVTLSKISRNLTLTTFLNILKEKVAFNYVILNTTTIVITK